MGWSHTSAAGQTLRSIEERCRQTREGKEDASTNTYYVGESRRFYEVERCDQPDGGIVGEIHEMFDRGGRTWCRLIDTFRIDGSGAVMRGPELFRDVVPRIRDLEGQTVLPFDD